MKWVDDAVARVAKGKRKRCCVCGKFWNVSRTVAVESYVCPICRGQELKRGKSK